MPGSPSDNWDTCADSNQFSPGRLQRELWRHYGRDRKVISIPTTPGGWRCIIADPPWRFNDRGCEGAAAKKYPTMSEREIVLLPVKEVTAPDCVMAMWAVDTHLEMALRIVDAWGFRFKHLYVWVKIGTSGKLQIGLGHYMRKCHEVALICTRGKPAILDHGVPSACLASRGRHSAKPPDLHAALERLCPGPRLELFARARRPGWTGWGNQCPESD